MDKEDIPLWRNKDKQDPDTNAEVDKVYAHNHPFDTGSSRRSFIRTAAGMAGATGLLLGGGLSIPTLAGDDDDDDRSNRCDDQRDGDADDAASPLPIPGGTVLPFST